MVAAKAVKAAAAAVSKEATGAEAPARLLMGSDGESC